MTEDITNIIPKIYSILLVKYKIQESWTHYHLTLADVLYVQTVPLFLIRSNAYISHWHTGWVFCKNKPCKELRKVESPCVSGKVYNNIA